MAKAHEQVRVVYRSSVDGQFVKPTYARNHPATTERQHVHVSSPAPQKHPKK